MPWIQNISLSNTIKGYHYDPGPNSLLIQIVDPGMQFPVARYNFAEIHQFQFLDIESDELECATEFGKTTQVNPAAISQLQADSIASLLTRALEQQINVTVHCVAGICRSGAVTEVGVMLGFKDLGTFRSPNLLVKNKLIKSLGWSYDSEIKE